MDRGEFIMGQNWVEQFRENVRVRGWISTEGLSACESARRRGTDVFPWNESAQGRFRWSMRDVESDPVPSLIK